MEEIEFELDFEGQVGAEEGVHYRHDYLSHIGLLMVPPTCQASFRLSLTILSAWSTMP